MARRAGLVPLFMLLGILICGAQIRAQAVPTQIAPPPSTDLSKLDSDALQWLQDLIRINTTNPPGNELAAAKYVSGVLQSEGIASETYESTPGRGFLVARLSSSAVPDPSRALLLVAHLDAGTADKNMLAANLAVFVGLKRSGARLDRDVILLAEGDEEGGGAGMKFATEKYWDKIAAGYALNEGGRVVLKDGKIRYVAVQASEKTPVSVDIIATGTSGSASVPAADNAIVHLASAIEKIAAYEAPVQFNTVTTAYFEGLASAEDEDTAKWMRALESSDRADHAARWISSANPEWNAMLRDTISPAMLQAGTSPSAVPPEARGILEIGLLPGDVVGPAARQIARARERSPGAIRRGAGRGRDRSLLFPLFGAYTQQSRAWPRSNFPALRLCP